MSNLMKMRALCISASLAVLASPVMAQDWSYDGKTGPDHWGKVAEVCEAGLMQSPIDLGAVKATGNINLEINYSPVTATVVDNGRTLQADFGEGMSVTSAGTVFNALQVHFHTPSEHAIDGERYPLVGHVVHASADSELLVVGVMFEEGDASPALQALLDNVGGDAVTMDVTDLLPDDKSLYRYMGSLTTPPCSEGVNWHVMAKPMTASAEQIAAFENAMGMNARPVLPLNGRLLVGPSE